VVRVGGVAFRVDYESVAAARPATPAGDDTVPLPTGAVADAEEAAPADQGDTAFAGLAAAEEPPAAGLDWPTTEAASAQPADDDNLNDFFKSLS
jgi:hypothetical protein